MSFAPKIIEYYRKLFKIIITPTDFTDITRIGFAPKIIENSYFLVYLCKSYKRLPHSYPG